MAALVAPGFDGSVARLERVRAALERVDRAFPQHLEAARVPGLLYPEDVEQNERLDARVRAHAAPRLAFDPGALRSREERDHASMQLRRFAWFVPPLLASWLEARPAPPFARLHGHVIQSMLEEATIAEEDDWTWEAAEAEALASFFDAALSAALATTAPSFARGRDAAPRGRDAAPDERDEQASAAHPLVEGELVGAPRSLETIELAVAMRVPHEPLVTRWLDERTLLADEHLLRAVRGPTTGWHVFAEERWAIRLVEAGARSGGSDAARYDEAAARVRRHSARARQVRAR